MAFTVFAAMRGNNDFELWGTDGTTGRTSLIKDINAQDDPASSVPGVTLSGMVGNTKIGSTGGSLPFAVAGNFAYFSATDGLTGQELWRTDGTNAGTIKLTDIVGDTAPMNIVNAGGKIYFFASGGGSGAGIYKFDPALFTGTVNSGISFITADNGIASGSGMFASGNRIYWTASAGSGSVGTSDGTTTNAALAGGGGSTPTIYDAGGTVYILSAIGGISKTTGGAPVAVTGASAQSGGFIHTSTHVYIIAPNANALYQTNTGITTASQITAAGLTFNFQFSGIQGHVPGFAALGDKLIFSNSPLNDNVGTVGRLTGAEVWISNGTGAGTFVLKDIVGGTGSSNPHNFFTVGSSVFFQATNGNGSVELWKTDGTTLGTVLVDTLFAGGVSSGDGSIASTRQIENMSVSNGVLYFSFDDGVHGNELWRSDGTAAGTLMLKELNFGFFDQGFETSYTIGGASLGPTGVFVGWTQRTGYELFVTDGTTGAGLLKDIDPGGGNSMPREFVVAGNKAYFSAYSPIAGTELWVTNGTAAGTALVKDINGFVNANGSPSGLTSLGGKVYFAADNGINGFEPWVSDGTTAGTFMLLDAFTGSTSGFPNSGGASNFALAGGFVYFVSTNFSSSSGDTNAELYVTNGLPGGTAKIEINPTGPGGRNSAFPSIQPAFTEFGGKAYFFANNGVNGTELWSSQGTAGTTLMVKNVITGDVDGIPGEDGLNPALGMFVVNGKLIFVNFTGSGGQFYVSDGTDPGTVVHGGNNFSGFSTPVVLGTKLVFTVSNGGPSGAGVYATDGTGAGPVLVSGAAVNPGNLTPLGNGSAVFSAFDATNGTELWITNGTTASVLKNINTTAVGAGSNPSNFVRVGNLTYFKADNGVTGDELWVTDGTAINTVLLKDINLVPNGPGKTMGSSIFAIRAVDNNHLQFLATNGISGGAEMWISNGTPGGTVQITDVFQSSGSFNQSFSFGGLNGGGASTGTFASVPLTLPAGDTGETFFGTNEIEFFTGLGGNDTVHFGAFYTDDDFFNGGAGTDTVTLTGNYNIVLGGGSELNLLNFEVLGLFGGTFHVTLDDDFLNLVNFTIDASSLSSTTLTLIGIAETNSNLIVNGGGGADFIATGSGNDIVTGGGGNDTLDGFTGNDQMIGGTGDDWFIVRESADLVFDGPGGGNDRVFAYVDWAISPFELVETLSTYNELATDPIDLTGNAAAQLLQGNAGNNILDGLGGGDVMTGFGGDDWYLVRTGVDQVFEGLGQGNDRVFAYTSFTLAPNAFVETLSTYNAGTSEAIDLTGSDSNQTIYGNAGANRIDGKYGSDILLGDAGADIYAFTSVLGADNVDQVFGFQVGFDKLGFAGISQASLLAGAFRSGQFAQDNDDRIIYDPATGALYYDGDGVGGAAQVQFATLIGAPPITANDFVTI